MTPRRTAAPDLPPTSSFGELDLHLAGEGRHEEIYRRLGAHVRTVDGTTGVSFAVWAPNAAGVSVVGDFNHWEQGADELHALGGSGIWETFVPEAAPGHAYKFAITDVLSLLGVFVIFVAAIGRQMRGNLVPVKDPNLGASLAFENY